MDVISVNCASATLRRIEGKDVLTAIGKRAVSGPVAVHALGLEGDDQADRTVHGGLAKAVYAYSVKHHPFWQTVRAQARVAAWDAPLWPGAMGENLSVDGIDETQLWVGDRLQGPGCTLVVSEPRLPCFKFAEAMGFAQAVKLMVQSGYCGFYLAVLHAGTVTAGDHFELIPGPREVGLLELFRARART